MKRGHDSAVAPQLSQDMLTGLARRLQAAADALIPEGHSVGSDALAPEPQRVAATVGALLALLCRLCAAPGRTHERWLLLVAVTGRFPTTAEFRDLDRSFDLQPHERVATGLLASLASNDAPYPAGGMRVVTDSAVVEVSYCAQADHHTGIQRVVRETVPRWAQDHALVPVAWDPSRRALRTISGQERARVFAFGAESRPEAGAEDFTPELVVPFRTDVLFPDVPVVWTAAAATACLAEFSGNRVGHVGYDLIPMTSADTRPDGEAVSTAETFAVIKHSHRVACISSSATAEFAGMVATLPTQGLTGPDVREVTLPAVAAALPPGPDARRRPARPVVLLTGTREPHKNHRTALFAAERLWREGLDFEVRQVGGKGWNDDAYQAAARRLMKAGRPLTMMGRVSEQRLWDELRAADVVVFISLHEGYGLPIAEALSVGTPVITTAFGSQAEVAADGGCLVADPRDDDDVTDALRRIITEPKLRERLEAEALRRPSRTWDDYARELWAYLIDGDLEPQAN